MEQNELMHYGVIGMKWGVHRGNVAQAYSKATAKRKKLENRVVQAKKAYDKATVKANSGASMKYQKLQAKADKLSYKAEKAHAKKLKRANPLIRTSTSDARYQNAARLSDKAEAKYIKAQTKANKYKSKYEKGQAAQGSAKTNYLKAQRKAEKWRNAMDKTFKDYDVNNLPSDKVDSGKEFVKKVA